MKIALADAVAAVRDELLEAATRAAGSDVAFMVREVQLEFSVELRQDATSKAGFTAWVVSADAGASVGRSSAHRVSVTLNPRRHDGHDEWLITGDDQRPEGPGDVSGHLGR
ncbi:trypco2 family protein [Catellatospora sp. NPDC049133]|uniref:trypco2 family protein n=1 Tax=Catellatospora sp. NPDC049133 TaxID=3155499 RepID=UPI0033C98293